MKEFIPMTELGLDNKFMTKKLRSWVPKACYGILLSFLVTGSIMFSISLHKVKDGTVEIIAGKEGFQSSFFVKFPWDSSSRTVININRQNMELNNVITRTQTKTWIYKTILISYDIINIEKYIKNIQKTNIETFIGELKIIAENRIEKIMHNITNTKMTHLTKEIVDPFSNIDYIDTIVVESSTPIIILNDINIEEFSGFKPESFHGSSPPSKPKISVKISPME